MEAEEPQTNSPDVGSLVKRASSILLSMMTVSLTGLHAKHPCKGCTVNEALTRTPKSVTDASNNNSTNVDASILKAVARIVLDLDKLEKLGTYEDL